MIPAWAKVGAKVVCIRYFRPSRFREAVPEKGKVYKIRKVCVRKACVGLRFSEIVNNQHKYREGLTEISFSVKDFRPVQTKTQEQDMEMFTPLLNTTTQKESA